MMMTIRRPAYQALFLKTKLRVQTILLMGRVKCPTYLLVLAEGTHYPTELVELEREVVVEEFGMEGNHSKYSFVQR